METMLARSRSLPNEIPTNSTKPVAGIAMRLWRYLMGTATTKKIRVAQKSDELYYDRQLAKRVLDDKAKQSLGVFDARVPPYYGGGSSI
jgi:hypothetical protein